MADANELVQSLKKAAVDAMDAMKPVNVYFGEVTATGPLTINVEQKMVLGEAQLVLTRNVTDFDTMVTINLESEDDIESHRHNIDLTDSANDRISGMTEKADAKHSHTLTGQKQITIHNALETGDEVIMIRQQEGQKFIVVDRIGGRS